MAGGSVYTLSVVSSVYTLSVVSSVYTLSLVSSVCTLSVVSGVYTLSVVSIKYFRQAARTMKIKHAKNLIMPATLRNRRARKYFLHENLKHKLFLP